MVNGSCGSCLDSGDSCTYTRPTYRRGRKPDPDSVPRKLQGRSVVSSPQNPLDFCNAQMSTRMSSVEVISRWMTRALTTQAHAPKYSACESCRQSKVKCVGWPCNRCESRRSVCTKTPAESAISPSQLRMPTTESDFNEGGRLQYVQTICAELI
jgi:hypothetical protein